MSENLPSGENIFLKIKEKKERDSIFNSLVQKKSEFLAKGSIDGGKFFVLLPESYQYDKLRCKLTGADTDLPKDDILIVHFYVGAEKYLSQMKFERKLDSVYFDTSADLFHLQRREDFRLKLPSGYRGQFKVAEFNDLKVNLQFKLTDISGGGCRMEVPKKVMIVSKGDKLTGLLELSQRPAIAVCCEIRHVEQDKEYPDVIFFGGRFINLSKISKNKLIAVVMDLYRELFAKLKKQL